VTGPNALPFLEHELESDFEGEPLYQDYSSAPASQYFNLRKLSIYGGSNEIQKNIIAKRVLEI
jgi:alkylation response protein AidB-like acyl-CoA dehydrogenase